MSRLVIPTNSEAQNVVEGLYKDLERRIIADEDWWKLRQWRQFSDKGNPNDDRPASGWLFNVIMGKHADAVAAYPGPVIRPREPDDRGHEHRRRQRQRAHLGPRDGVERAVLADALVDHPVHSGAERL